jgi:hypothetical protein
LYVMPGTNVEAAAGRLVRVLLHMDVKERSEE